MAMWLWVDKLDPKNDWIMLKSFQFGGSQNPYGGQGQGRGHLRSSDFHEATFTLDPGRFLTRLYSWVINGTTGRSTSSSTRRPSMSSPPPWP